MCEIQEPERETREYSLCSFCLCLPDHLVCTFNGKKRKKERKEEEEEEEEEEKGKEENAK